MNIDVQRHRVEGDSFIIGSFAIRRHSIEEAAGSDVLASAREK